MRPSDKEGRLYALKNLAADARDTRRPAADKVGLALIVITVVCAALGALQHLAAM